MAEPNKLDFQIPAKFQSGNGDYLVFDEAEGLDWNGLNVLDEDGKVVGTITDFGMKVSGFIHVEATIECQEVFDKMMKQFEHNLARRKYSMGYNGD